jgi:hypothetical protein
MLSALVGPKLQMLIAYVVLAYTKLGKPLSSRIILNDINAVFEETAASALPYDVLSRND